MAVCPTCHSFFLAKLPCPKDKTLLIDDVDAEQRGIQPHIDDRYTLFSTLGEGGMGAVFLAEHRQLGRRVAIKMLRPDQSDEQSLTRFQREARSASMISHRNVITILDFGQLLDQTLFYVMEYLEGDSLAVLLEEQTAVPIARAFSIVYQVAQGMQAAHDKGIIHRDLKPENIFLVKDPSLQDLVKIIDFGIAKVAGEQRRITRAGIALGTPDYMSPEQALGQNIDHRTDIYAFGVLCYELLSGRLPFEGSSLMEILSRHLYAAPQKITERFPDLEIPLLFEEIIRRCMQKQPENRYQSMSELLEDLEQLSQTIPSRDVLRSRLSSQSLAAVSKPREEERGTRRLRPKEEPWPAVTREESAEPATRVFIPSSSGKLPDFVAPQVTMLETPRVPDAPPLPSVSAQRDVARGKDSAENPLRIEIAPELKAAVGKTPMVDAKTSGQPPVIEPNPMVPQKTASTNKNTSAKAQHPPDALNTMYVRPSAIKEKAERKQAVSPTPMFYLVTALFSFLVVGLLLFLLRKLL